MDDNYRSVRYKLILYCLCSLLYNISSVLLTQCGNQIPLNILSNVLKRKLHTNINFDVGHFLHLFTFQMPILIYKIDLNICLLIYIINREMCIHEGCKIQSIYNVEGESKALFCSVHKLEGVSEKNGGTHEINNLRPICGACNHSMSTENMIDFVVKYGLYIG